MESEIKIPTARTNLFRKSRNEVVEVSAIERSWQPTPRRSQSIHISDLSPPYR